MFERIDWNVIAAAIFGLFVVYFLSRAFYRPLRIVLRGILQIVLGGAVIFLYNLVAAMWGLTVGLNLITALIVGMMGLPGIGMLVGLQYIFS